MYETVHVPPEVPLKAVRVQVADGLKVPVLLVVKVTVPVGFVGFNEVSITLAVQAVAKLTMTEPGEQAIVVVVGCCPGETGTEARLKPPLLMACAVSPLYEPVIKW